MAQVDKLAIVVAFCQIRNRKTELPILPRPPIGRIYDLILAFLADVDLVAIEQASPSHAEIVEPEFELRSRPIPRTEQAAPLVPYSSEEPEAEP